MIRYFLAKGDRGGSAMITDGLDSVTCSNPPPAVQIATVGMETYCTACKQKGFIAPKGPRWPGTGPNGKQWALSGDINICGCNPPPVFYPIRERRMSMSFTSEQAAAMVDDGVNAPAQQTQTAQYDEQFVLHDANGRVLCDTYYTVRLPSGSLVHGTTDSAGRTARHVTEGAQSVRIYLGRRESV